MNNFNKSLLAVFMISLFSLVSIQSINHIVNGNPQVLGENTGSTIPPVTCKTGVNSFGVNTSCGTNLYRAVTVVCHDGFKTTLGDPSSCKPPESWKQAADRVCEGRSNCQPTPVPPTPTPISTTSIPCEEIKTLEQKYCSPTSTPAAPPVGETFQSIPLVPQPPFVPNAFGKFAGSVVKNTNGYWDFKIMGYFQRMIADRNYQLFLCGVNCSSATLSKFVPDRTGNATINVTINHNQAKDPITRVAVWEIPQPGPISTDPTACMMTSISSKPCLQGKPIF